MTEFYVELQDADGTCFVFTDPWDDETIYFEDLDEARMYAKNQVNEQYILVRVIEDGTGRVVDYFKM
jgi:hypothetical protein